LDIIDTYAAANGLKRSEAIRALIDEGCDIPAHQNC
jgi:hypothetical protein